MSLRTRLLSLFPRNPFSSRIRDVRQGEMAECGLAALASLMSFYGANVPLDRLRELAASTLYGSSLRTLHKLAIRLGFDASARRVENVADLAKHLPCLVHLNFIHFAVVEQVTRHEVLLSDPLAGPVRMPIDRFSRAFTGIALTLKPTRFLRSERAAPSPSRRTLLKQPGMLVAYAAAAGSGGAIAAAAILAGAGIDGGGGMAPLLVAIGAAALLAEAAVRCSTGAMTAYAQAEQDAVIDHVAAQPAAAFVLRATVQSNALLGAPVSLVDAVLIDGALAAAAAAAMLAGAVIAAPLMAFAGTAMLCAEAAALAAMMLWRGKPVPHARWQSLPVRTPSGEELLRADGWGLGRGGEGLFRGMAGSHAQAAVGSMPGAERGAVLAGMRAGFAGLRLLVLLLAGAVLLDGGVDAGPLFAAGMLVMIAGSQLGRIAAAAKTPQVTTALHRLADRSRTAWGDPPQEPPAGMALVLDQVAWRPAEMLPDAVRDVSFAIPDGSSLAVVAAPRSGSTLIARLAAGWISPGSGAVLAAPAILLGTQWLLSAGRLGNLLAIGSDISDAAMMEVLEALGLARVIAPRGGLDLKLSAGAPELSGGQKRRLMLAAALLRNPALLVLDGTLEAIGTASAAQFLALCRARGTAVLLTGHRADLADLCDARYEHKAVPA